METRASYVLIGSFTLAILAAAFLFVLWIGKLSFDREWDYYDIVFTEAVTGLTVGGAVQYSGIQVGEVRKLSLDPADPKRVIARARVNAGTPIKADTRARLTFTGITGVALIQLSGGTPEAGPIQLAEGETVPRIVADESALQKLLASSEGIVTSVNEMVVRLSLLLNDENIARIEATIDHIEQVTGTLADRKADIGQAVADVGEASRALKRTLAETEALVRRLEAASANAERLLGSEASELLASARASLDSAKRFTDAAYATVEENRDAVASFANQGLAQTGPAVAELRATLRNLQKLADRLEDDPAAYLLGRDQPREYEAR
jgi:phospholipid/cholesterol/gamma-HCH transport system substrate-binding protein